MGQLIIIKRLCQKMFYPTFYRDCWININSEVWMFMLFLLSYPSLGIKYSVPKLYLKPKWTNKSIIIIIIMQDAFDNGMSYKRNDWGGGADDAVSQTQPCDGNTHHPLHPLGPQSWHETRGDSWIRVFARHQNIFQQSLYILTQFWPATGAEHLWGGVDMPMTWHFRPSRDGCDRYGFQLPIIFKNSTVRFFSLNLARETDWIVNRSSSRVFTSAARAWQTVFTSELFCQSFPKAIKITSVSPAVGLVACFSGKVETLRVCVQFMWS